MQYNKLFWKRLNEVALSFTGSKICVQQCHQCTPLRQKIKAHSPVEVSKEGWAQLNALLNYWEPISSNLFAHCDTRPDVSLENWCSWCSVLAKIVCLKCWSHVGSDWDHMGTCDSEHVISIFIPASACSSDTERKIQDRSTIHMQSLILPRLIGAFKPTQWISVFHYQMEKIDWSLPLVKSWL